MAQLILTQEEKVALSWLDLSDEELGKVCRYWTAELQQLPDGDRPKIISFAMLLCNYVARANAKQSRFSFKGLSDHGKETGDWQITIRRTKPPRKS